MKADEEKREDLLKILQERQKVEDIHIIWRLLLLPRLLIVTLL